MSKSIHSAPDSLPADSNLGLMEDVFTQYQSQKGALIPILQKTQAIYGYLPPPAMQLIARRLNTSISKVYGVATFYAQFYLEPRGRHVLRVCDGTACHVKGTPALLTAVADRYGIRPDETTADGELTVEIVYCLGSCALAPVAVLDGEVMGRMRHDSLVRSVQKRLSKNGEEVRK